MVPLSSPSALQSIDSSFDMSDLEHFDEQEAIPLSALPPLPARGTGYWTEPLMGVCVVGMMSFMLVGATHSVATVETVSHTSLARILVVLIWSEAGVAAACVAFLLFAGAGEIKRTPKTCYPIPAEVEQKLLAGEILDGLQNPRGPHGSKTLGSYCVRCLVWRPPATPEEPAPHHCKVCGRCVTGFDHHCGVFGRCIVAGNMPCFVALIAMLFCGMLTAMVAMSITPNSSSATY
eukprot:TRINITY_DN20514_c0_g1_i1.p1 TRINITY_DN20514_c0_g1~~TRINITY_DN20514_c0_g1_i1.p1  ORF type:complete len:234 (+),score=37.72 TRINITY_DN20514_c0_g1_i1:63-764(+)